MAGVYIHIPFCKSRCAYCDFFSTTQLSRREEYVRAILNEWEERKEEINEPIRTVYFGGGTPSLLTPESIDTIMQAIDYTADAECTMEANPGDITKEYLHAVRETGINRLSIGIQSFNDTLLQTIGRRHNAQQALQAVEDAKEAGFDNLSIDLIYGLPGQNMNLWKKDIEQAIMLHPQHISTYCLSYEEGTPLTLKLRRGEVKEVDEDTENKMYDHIASILSEEGYNHYEISNFALQDCYSRHNSSYWNDTPYVGLGAGAHSYDGNSRSWNQSNLSGYIEDSLAHRLHRESETLTEEDKINEKIMLGLRTRNGVQWSVLPHPEIAKDYMERGLLRREENKVIATLNGIHILNRIIEDLMI